MARHGIVSSIFPTSMLLVLTGIALIVSITTSSAAPTNTGQIQGKIVLDQDSSALAGATVTAYRIAPAPTVSATGTTGKDGSFAIAGLSSGQFGLCVSESTGTLIDPCQWVDLGTTVSVTDGATASGVSVRMKKASTLSVRINDSAQVLSQKAGDAAPPHVLVGAFDLKGVFHPALQTKVDGAGVNYALNLPFDFPVRLTVYSAKVQLQDNQHTAVPAGGLVQMVVNPSSNQSQQASFVFNAVGRNP